METFDLNFNVQVDPKGPKKHLGFHVAGETEDEAKATLKAELELVIAQIGTPAKAAKTAAAKAPAKPKAPAKKK